ncbi:MAG TPA: YqeG family HAD IIIA-type phosphatase [Candidatus Eremiobacteraceae bacterium]|nr:YqeG family HAD IIIA-type phosphatase [Candidatus Eremiobacteraceae bacterium]
MKLRNPRQLMRPFRFVAGVSSISLQELADEGIRGIVIDLDNTLVGWKLLEPTPEVAAWVRAALDRGFAVAIVSNNVRAWVKSVATRLGIVTFVHTALKPLPFGVIQAVKQLRVRRSETVVVGDQLFADVLAAKLLGIRAILTEPIVKREHRAMSLIRAFERFILASSTKKSP